MTEKQLRMAAMNSEMDMVRFSSSRDDILQTIANKLISIDYTLKELASDLRSRSVIEKDNNGD